MPNPIQCRIKAFANCQHVIIAWRYDKLIPNCIGFALYKKLNGETDAAAEPLNNRIGFADQKPAPGEQRPSTQWPIQRFMWTDYDVNPNDKVSYMVVPILINNTRVTKDVKNSSNWSETVTICTGNDIEAYFNRGILSSQFMSRSLAKAKADGKDTSLATILSDIQSPITAYLGGVLTKHLFNELSTVANNKDLSIYASLYELNEVNIIEVFKKIGARLHLVLANGAFDPKDKDENAELRLELKKTTIDLHDRIVKSGHFAHNKFMVFCKNDKPYKVWTGSTNLTQSGLFTQVNNAVLINDPVVAKNYLDEWKQIKDAGNDYPASFIANNSKGIKASKGVTTWFAPVNDFVDLAPARKLINSAKQGILFLFFNPGVEDTLYSEVVNQISKPGNENLFVHGIMNQDPGGKAAPLVFIHKGNKQSTDYDTIIPKNIKDDFSFWQDEITPKMVTIHSKVIIIDPFGNNPVVMTGSHNLGKKASSKNDDNLNIIQGNKPLAIEYAVNILSVYDHFRWRYALATNKKSQEYKGLSTDTKWMDSYMAGNNMKQINFMLPEPGATDKTTVKVADKKSSKAVLQPA